MFKKCWPSGGKSTEVLLCIYSHNISCDSISEKLTQTENMKSMDFQTRFNDTIQNLIEIKDQIHLIAFNEVSNTVQDYLIRN